VPQPEASVPWRRVAGVASPRWSPRSGRSGQRAASTHNIRSGPLAKMLFMVSRRPTGQAIIRLNQALADDSGDSPIMAVTVVAWPAESDPLRSIPIWHGLADRDVLQHSTAAGGHGDGHRDTG
jgi:hypothetical protein